MENESECFTGISKHEISKILRPRSNIWTKRASVSPGYPNRISKIFTKKNIFSSVLPPAINWMAASIWKIITIYLISCNKTTLYNIPSITLSNFVSFHWSTYSCVHIPGKPRRRRDCDLRIAPSFLVRWNHLAVSPRSRQELVSPNTIIWIQNI